MGDWLTILGPLTAEEWWTLTLKEAGELKALKMVLSLRHGFSAGEVGGERGSLGDDGEAEDGALGRAFDPDYLNMQVEVNVGFIREIFYYAEGMEEGEDYVENLFRRYKVDQTVACILWMLILTDQMWRG